MSILKNKKLYTITLLVFLMFTIILMSQFFVQDIKQYALSNNDAEKFNIHILREGKYSFSLPEGWNIEDINDIDGDIFVGFNKDNRIHGNVTIIDGNLKDSCNNITNEEDNIKVFEEGYKWNIITLKNNSYTSKYYLRDYSEGKVLMLKFSYKDIREKDSIKIVFDNIAMSFN